MTRHGEAEVSRGPHDRELPAAPTSHLRIDGVGNDTTARRVAPNRHGLVENWRASTSGTAAEATTEIGGAPNPTTAQGCSSGLPITWALADPKLDERQVLMAVLEHDPALTATRPGLTIIADKGYTSAELDRYLAERGATLLRPSYRNHRPRPGEHLLEPIRQLIESVNDTLKGQLDLELHSGRSIDGVGTRIGQRLLAPTAAIWHNRATGQPVTRSLIAYDH